MAPTVTIQFQTAAAKKAVDKAATRILTALARATAEGGAANAPRRSGFLASTVGHIPPNGAGVSARAALRQGSPKHAAAIPAPGPDHAIAYAAASYALAVELRQPFLLTAAIAAMRNLDALIAREAI